jgi:hypothetical protein
VRHVVSVALHPCFLFRDLVHPRLTRRQSPATAPTLPLAAPTLPPAPH